MPSILDWRVVPQGQHNAIIEQVELNFSAVTWLKIGYRIQFEGQDYWIREMLALDAPLDAPSYQRTAEGKGRIRQILQVLSLSENDIQDFADIETRLGGAQVQIIVAHKSQHGLPVPVVRAVIGKGRASAEAVGS
jgi:hypothetical protein